MTIEVLVATMHQKDHSFLDHLNLQSDAVVINQCDENSYTEYSYNGHTICCYSFAERGVGLSRNNALMRATSDIILFADEDIVYEDGYGEAILKAYAAAMMKRQS